MTALPSLTDVHPFDRVEDILFTLDVEGRITFANAFARHFWGKRPHELLGKTLEVAFTLKPTPEVRAAYDHALKHQQRTEFDTFGLRLQTWINVTLYPDNGGLVVLVKPLPRHAGTPTLADYDALTGCLTRAAFQTALQTFPRPYVLAILDLNLLKSVNTLRGHSGGDAHIRTVAQSLREVLPPDALICRWGGDEFVILAPGEDQNAVETLLDETNARLPQPLPDVSAYTVGLAVREHGTAYERAFALADEQLELRKEHLRQSVPSDREADSLVTFSQELEALRDPGDLIDHALNRLLNLLDFDQVTYTNIEGDDIFNSHHAYRDGAPVPQPELNVRSPLARTGLVQVARRTRVTEWSTDYPNTPNRMQNIVDQGVKTVLVTPVFYRGRVVACLVLRAVNRWRSITPHLRKIVELTALRLEHALELRRAVGEVRSTLEAGMLTLGVVLEARDFETQGHTHRAALMAEALGEQLGLTDTELRHLSQGAYLHDLGKLGVPDSILKKPGQLTPEEWTVMKSHVLQGYDLASRITRLSTETLGVIRSHHERWDGSGYPDGLAGTDIPLEARIFAVCDVYDALISQRPYKEAWTHEQATSEIERQAGRHFDPDVVRAFLSVMAEQGDRLLA